jgi:hypothetical protein
MQFNLYIGYKVDQNLSKRLTRISKIRFGACSRSGVPLVAQKTVIVFIFLKINFKKKTWSKVSIFDKKIFKKAAIFLKC